MWTKLPPVISLNPDLTKDLNGWGTYIKGELIWKCNKERQRQSTSTRQFTIKSRVCSGAGPLTVKRRRMGKCEARIGHSHTGHYLWCRYIQRGIWAASLSVRLRTASWQRRPKPGASIPSTLSILSLLCPGIPFLLSRSSTTITPAHATSRQNAPRFVTSDLTSNIKCFLIFFFFFFVIYIFFSVLFVLMIEAGVVARGCRLVSMLLASQ